MRSAALNNKSAELTKLHFTEHAIKKSFTPEKQTQFPKKKKNATTLLKNKRTVPTILIFFLLGGGVERQRRKNPQEQESRSSRANETRTF
jgi:hypothetical protein